MRPGPRRALAALSLVSLAWPTTAQPSAATAAGSAAPRADNLVHPEGYETTELGMLGGLEGVGEGAREMVLIPGFGLHAEVFRPFVEHNRERYRMLLATPAGFGESPAPPMPVAADASSPVSYGERTWCRAFELALIRRMAKRRIERPILVGYSDGAQHALRLALEHPDRVAGVVSIAGEPFRVFPLLEAGAPRTQLIDEQLARGRLRTVTRAAWNAGMGRGAWYSAEEELGARLYEARLLPTIPTMVRYSCEKWSYDPRPDLAELVEAGGFDVPILALVPDSTQLADDAAYQRYLRAAQLAPWEELAEIAEVEVVRIDGARLGLLHDRTAAVSDAVAAFVERLE